MFDFILYPVSAILWFWHRVFGTVLGPDNGFAWALSVFFLVFTLRVVLLKPAISQMRAGRKMAKFSPQIQKLREKYKNDKQRMAQEMQKLQSEHGVNPIGGCLPALLQIPVFLSLFHVLRGFTPQAQSNYIFDRAGVESFINADIFGAKLGNWLSQPAAVLEAFGTTRLNMIAVGLPLMVIASIATFTTMRMSMKRQTDASMANPQTAMMGKFMMYVAPVGTLFSGWVLPIAIVLYFMANNIWTLGQQHFLSNKIDREQEREKQKELAAKKDAPRPKPGQKPGQVKKAEETADSESGGEDSAASATAVNGAKATANSGGGGGNRRPQQKKRPGKQAASAKKGQKKRR
ncbi:membrane protein insertase YidC [Saccharopolyspora sp. 6V]|nr:MULTISPECIES: membrane protein insertase YidC [Saccharopolyspora]MCA1185686.1 membrane protein insertase YidC [Saccharopolyspora sp. 6T]MCA1191595.1 membrane protein insertase YidC [Saccharopolyspora sp. 6V]MCA1227429.1 membrane protein insertase YidC [Saccharopolyspora sp. 6M]MCA1280907.1 membrane protein insertase YidC [Saccharopolyspora sp. 7B]